MAIPGMKPGYWGKPYKPGDRGDTASKKVVEWGIDVGSRRDHPEVIGRLPICPYGCGREGTLLEIVMGEGGQAIGIFNDRPCTCVFRADIELGEPPTKRKLVIGPDGEMHEEGEHK